MEAPVFFAEEEWLIMDYRIGRETQMKIKDEKGTILDLTLDLSGIYQLKNVLSVLSAVKQMNISGWAITNAHLQHALSNVQLLTGLNGRWQIWTNDQRIVLDVGHNEDGVRQVIEQIKISVFEQLHIIIGMVRDKDIQNVLKLLPDNAIYYFTQASLPRALPAEDLKEKANVFHLKGASFSDSSSAIEMARKSANHNDMILICGSVFLVGEAIAYLKNIKN
jgi:dihydrofolate synthase/folylpolyglutamate synthase